VREWIDRFSSFLPGYTLPFFLVSLQVDVGIWMGEGRLDFTKGLGRLGYALSDISLLFYENGWDM
jgi:hypothetical protein